MTEARSAEGRNSGAELRALRQRMQSLAAGRYFADLDDIAADAWIRLDRALGREPAQNLEALMTSVAWRAWVDFCRKKAAERRALGQSVDIDEMELAIPEEERAIDPDALATWRFAMSEWFQRNQPQCLDPARTVFEGRTWGELAEALGAKPNSLAKRWQRCRESFLAAARADRGDLRKLLLYFEALAT